MQQIVCRPSEDDILAFLKSTDIFGQFSKTILKDFITDSEWVSLNEGDNLFRQGDAGGFFCLVYAGRLQVSVVKPDGSFFTVATIEPGMPVGEIQFLSGGSRTASVDALQKTQLIKFSKMSFERLVAKVPKVLQIFAEVIRRRLRRYQLVEILPFFCGPIDLTMLNTIESVIEWVHLPLGQALFYQGDGGDDFFLLISGRLAVSVRDKTGTARKVAEMRRGTIVGEMAMFTGEKRTASIHAIRNSELVRFSRRSFEQIITAHPNIMMHFIQFIIKRMQEITSPSQMGNKALNIALVPASPDVPLADFANRLAKALSAFGITLHLTSQQIDREWGIQGMAQVLEADPNNLRLASWLDEQETKYMNIIFETDMSVTPWTRRCLQHADRILIVAHSNSLPKLGKIETELLSSTSGINQASRILILMHPDGNKLPSGTNQWLVVRKIDSHYHVRENAGDDFNRLARLFTGNAIGLVLGGGGARGFAHIGVIRALNEASIPIDMVGGTSMGATISAQYAMGLDSRAMLAINKKAIALKPFREFTLPFIALIKSKRLDKVVKMMYGNTQIEDMWLNFFCVSSNLTTAEMVVHRKGSLGKSIRASSALPGIAKPVLDKNNFLVDGALFNNIPADIMKEITGGFVIMVNVSPDEDFKMPDLYKEIPSDLEILGSHINPFKSKIPIPSILDIMMRSIMVGSANKENQTIKVADFNFCPPVSRFGLLEFDAIDEIVDVGYQYAKERISELKKIWP